MDNNEEKFLIAEVCLPVLVDRNFDYLVDSSNIKIAKVGMAVKVAFGRGANDSIVLGIIVKIKPNSDVDISKLKPIDSLVAEIQLSEQILNFYTFAARYYATSLGMVLRVALPKLVRKYDKLFADFIVAYQITSQGKTAHSDLSLSASAKKQRALLALLAASDNPIPINLLKEQGFSTADCKTLLNKGFINNVELSPYKTVSSAHIFTNSIELNTEQLQAVNIISTEFGHHFAALLNGVTGSGKTEVYIRLIQQALLQQQQILLLVPEIGLTPQLIARFSSRFSQLVGVYHSSMSDVARKNIFLHTLSGTLPILVGTRSAIFLPFKRLGLIIVDEEHDASYKQQEGFRYQARDLALLRAKQLNIPIILGSATPSLESLYNVKLNKLKQLNLLQRATQASLPAINLLDMRRQIMNSDEVVAQPVLDKIRKIVGSGQQALLFLNRRGYSPLMICTQCDWRSECDNCSAYQTTHINKGKLICHHCGSEAKLPAQCPKCQGNLQFIGNGTEKLEQYITKQFPHQRVLRLDRDNQTTSKKLAAALDEIIAGEVDIILGTQLVVKGHHFPKLTFVCAVDCDQALYSSDFRAEERLLQQLIQVAGRAGRESAGELVIQTYLPDHPVFTALMQHNYIDYAEKLLAKRKQYMMPPVGAMLIIRANHREKDELFAYLRQLCNKLETHVNSNESASKSAESSKAPAELLRIFGPVSAAIERKNRLYYANLVIEADSKKILQKHLLFIKEVTFLLDKTNKFKAFIDVDPYE